MQERSAPISFHILKFIVHQPQKREREGDLQRVEIAGKALA